MFELWLGVISEENFCDGVPCMFEILEGVDILESFENLVILVKILGFVVVTAFE